MAYDLFRHLTTYGELIPDPDRLREARLTYAGFRAEHGLPNRCADLLSWPSANSKLTLSALPTYGLALAPADASGAYNTCRYSTPQCRSLCLTYAGRNDMPTAHLGQSVKTLFLAAYPILFVTLLAHEVALATHRHEGRIALRLNVLSDLPWEVLAPTMIGDFLRAGVTLYDYTKWPTHLRPDGGAIDLTRSATERHTWQDVAEMVRAGERVATVVAMRKHDTDTIAAMADHLGVPVVDGDVTDERFHEGACVVILSAKGRAKRAKAGGFVKAVPQAVPQAVATA